MKASSDIRSGCLDPSVRLWQGERSISVSSVYRYYRKHEISEEFGSSSDSCTILVGAS